MRIIVQEPFGCGKRVVWLDPKKIGSIRDLLQLLRAHFGDEDPIVGVRLAEHNAELQDLKVLRDGDCIRIIHSTDMDESNDEWITFNVGGQRFSTYRSTIVNNAPRSVLARMLNRDERMHCRRDNRGCFMIDRSPKYFAVLLDCIRNGQLSIPDNMCRHSLYREAQFYGIDNEPLARLRREFENRQYASKHEWITLNVRGRKFQTYRSTIMNYNYSGNRTSLADMICDNHPNCRKDMDGSYLIDRNPFTFPYILEYLKRRILYWPPGLDSTYMYYECMDYGISDPTIRSIQPSSSDSWGNRGYLDNDYGGNRLGYTDGSNRFGYSNTWANRGGRQGYYGDNTGMGSTYGNRGGKFDYSDYTGGDQMSFNNRRRRRHSDAFLEMNRGAGYGRGGNTNDFYSNWNRNVMSGSSNNFFNRSNDPDVNVY